MLIIGIFAIAISLFILYIKFDLIIFGKSAKGIIVGYGDGVKGTRNVKACSYRIKYEYDNKEYFANTLESVTSSSYDVQKHNLNKEVEIYFKPNKPEVVTIKGYYGTIIIGFAFLILGVLGVIISFLE